MRVPNCCKAKHNSGIARKAQLVHESSKLCAPILPIDPALTENAGIGKLSAAEAAARAGCTSKLEKILMLLKINELKWKPNDLNRLKKIVEDSLDAFAEDEDCLGHTNLVQHRIVIENPRPFRHKTRPVPFKRRAAVERELARLLRVGAIEPVTAGECPFASRITLAEKKDGSIRICGDYRDLNEQTVLDAYSLPQVQELIPKLAGAKYFACLDLLSGYHQVEVAPEDRYKTAFTTHIGMYQFRVMPFGLCNAPATFQRLMDRIFSDK